MIPRDACPGFPRHNLAADVWAAFDLSKQTCQNLRKTALGSVHEIIYLKLKRHV